MLYNWEKTHKNKLVVEGYHENATMSTVCNFIFLCASKLQHCSHSFEVGFKFELKDSTIIRVLQNLLHTYTSGVEGEIHCGPIDPGILDTCSFTSFPS